MTATLAPEARRTVSLFFSGNLGLGDVSPKFAKKKDDKGADVLVVEDVPIFRSGTFRDSMGYQHTWEDLHMAQMVSNNEYLKSRGFFPDPPVRKGHGSFLGDPMDSLIGYISSLRTEKRTSPIDSKEYTYILASYDILDLDAQQKVQSGLWRNRSAEVGFYLNNDDAEFWPVMMGFAYVDIPAVEGLNFSMVPGIGQTCSVMFDKEAPVTTPVDTTQSNGSPGAPAPTAPAQNSTTTNHQSTTPPAAPPAPPAAVPPAPHSFTVAGKPISDFTAVQAHINGLEEFQRETMEAGRKSYVSGLAGKNLILASQLEATEKFALGLSDDQYKAWMETFENAVPNQALGQHGSGPANSSGGPVPSPAELAIANDKAMYERHKMAGMSQENLERTSSYKRLKTQNLI